MKISFNKPTLYNYNLKQTNDKNYNKSAFTSPAFTAVNGYYTDLVQKGCKSSGVVPLYEYKNILNRIYNYKGYDNKPLFDIKYNKMRYPDINKEDEGLLFYAGYCDLSDDINRYLSKRELYKMTKAQAKDVVKVLDYSLNRLDEKYGKYSGIVYRQGFFPLGQHQFISTTKDPLIAAKLRGGLFINKDLDFSIIKTKNGHKITNFQREMGSNYAEEEDEILLSRKSKFKEIIDPQGEYLSLKKRFHKILEQHSLSKVDSDKIRIFEEI